MGSRADNPLVSIIIRTKNEEQWLKACLSAINTQSYKNHEVILVDNLSTDATLKVARRHNVATISKIVDYNPSAALNLGVKVSSGDICIFLSAHCVPVDDYWLEHLVEPIITGEAMCAYGRQLPTSNTTPDNARDLMITFGREKILQKYDFKFHNANSAIQKQILLKHKFDENLSNVEDWYWAANAIAHGEVIAYIPKAAVFHYHGLHQHDANRLSFRAGAVARLIAEAYTPNPYPEPFFNYKNWSGLAIFSNVKSGKIPFKFSELPVENVINNTDTEIQSPNRYEYNVTISREYDFHEFLCEMLHKAERRFDKIFDYIIFADLSFHNFDSSLANINASSLFEDWVDVASAARKITGKTVRIPQNDEVIHSNKFPKSGLTAEHVELILGQFSAMRANIIRQPNADSLRYKVTRYLTGGETFKEVKI